MANFLIIDDDAAVAEAMAVILRGAGHSPVVKTSGAAGLVEAKNGGPFDGAIIDVWLQGENGLDVAKTVSMLNPTFPFMIVSGGGPGSSLESVTARADALGAAAVLFKPFDNDELLDAVTKMLR